MHSGETREVCILFHLLNAMFDFHFSRRNLFDLKASNSFRVLDLPPQLAVQGTVFVSQAGAHTEIEL